MQRRFTVHCRCLPYSSQVEPLYLTIATDHFAIAVAVPSSVLVRSLRLFGLNILHTAHKLSVQRMAAQAASIGESEDRIAFGVL